MADVIQADTAPGKNVPTGPAPSKAPRQSVVGQDHLVIGFALAPQYRAAMRAWVHAVGSKTRTPELLHARRSRGHKKSATSATLNNLAQGQLIDLGSIRTSLRDDVLETVCLQITLSLFADMAHHSSPVRWIAAQLLVALAAVFRSADQESKMSGTNALMNVLNTKTWSPSDGLPPPPPGTSHSQLEPDIPTSALLTELRAAVSTVHEPHPAIHRLLAYCGHHYADMAGALVVGLESYFVHRSARVREVAVIVSGHIICQNKELFSMQAQEFARTFSSSSLLSTRSMSLQMDAQLTQSQTPERYAPVWSLVFLLDCSSVRKGDHHSSIQELSRSNSFRGNRSPICEAIALLAPLYVHSNPALTHHIFARLLQLGEKSASEEAAVRRCVSHIFSLHFKDGNQPSMFPTMLRLISARHHDAYDCLHACVAEYTQLVYARTKGHKTTDSFAGAGGGAEETKQNKQNKKKKKQSKEPVPAEVFDFLTSLLSHIRATPPLIRFGGLLCLHAVVQSKPEVVEHLPILFYNILSGCYDSFDGTAALSLSMLGQIADYWKLTEVQRILHGSELEPFNRQAAHRVASIAQGSRLGGPSRQIGQQRRLLLEAALKERPDAFLVGPSKASEAEMKILLLWLTKGLQFLKEEHQIHQLGLFSLLCEAATSSCLDPFVMQCLLQLLRTSSPSVKEAVVCAFEALAPLLDDLEESYFQAIVNSLFLVLRLPSRRQGDASAPPDHAAQERMLLGVFRTLVRLPFAKMEASQSSSLLQLCFGKQFHQSVNIRTTLYECIVKGHRNGFWKTDSLRCQAAALCLIGLGDENAGVVEAALSTLLELELDWPQLNACLQTHRRTLCSPLVLPRVKAYHELSSLLRIDDKDAAIDEKAVDISLKVVRVLRVVSGHIQKPLAALNAAKHHVEDDDNLDNTAEPEKVPVLAHWSALILARLDADSLQAILELQHSFTSGDVDRNRATCHIIKRLVVLDGFQQTELIKATLDVVESFLGKSHIFQEWALYLLSLLVPLRLNASELIIDRFLGTALNLLESSHTPMPIVHSATLFLESVILVQKIELNNDKALNASVQQSMDRIRDSLREALCNHSGTSSRIHFNTAARAYCLLCQLATSGTDESIAYSYYNYLKGDLAGAATALITHWEPSADPMLAKLSSAQLKLVMFATIRALGALNSTTTAPYVLEDLIPYLYHQDASYRSQALQSMFSQASLVSPGQCTYVFWLVVPLLGDMEPSVRKAFLCGPLARNIGPVLDRRLALMCSPSSLAKDITRIPSVIREESLTTTDAGTEDNLAQKLVGALGSASVPSQPSAASGLPPAHIPTSQLVEDTMPFYVQPPALKDTQLPSDARRAAVEFLVKSAKSELSVSPELLAVVHGLCASDRQQIYRLARYPTVTVPPPSDDQKKAPKAASDEVQLGDDFELVLYHLTAMLRTSFLGGSAALVIGALCKLAGSVRARACFQPLLFNIERAAAHDDQQGRKKNATEHTSGVNAFILKGCLAAARDIVTARSTTGDWCVPVVVDYLQRRHVLGHVDVSVLEMLVEAKDTSDVQGSLDVGVTIDKLVALISADLPLHVKGPALGVLCKLFEFANVDATSKAIHSIFDLLEESTDLAFHKLCTEKLGSFLRALDKTHPLLVSMTDSLKKDSVDCRYSRRLRALTSVGLLKDKVEEKQRRSMLSRFLADPNTVIRRQTITMVLDADADAKLSSDMTNVANGSTAGAGRKKFPGPLAGNNYFTGSRSADDGVRASGGGDELGRQQSNQPYKRLHVPLENSDPLNVHYLHSHAYTHLLDIYSLQSVTMYEALVAFAESNDHSAREHEHVSPTSMTKECDTGPLLKKMMARDPTGGQRLVNDVRSQLEVDVAVDAADFDVAERLHHTTVFAQLLKACPNNMNIQPHLRLIMELAVRYHKKAGEVRGHVFDNMHELMFTRPHPVNMPISSFEDYRRVTAGSVATGGTPSLPNLDGNKRLKMLSVNQQLQVRIAKDAVLLSHCATLIHALVSSLANVAQRDLPIAVVEEMSQCLLDLLKDDNSDVRRSVARAVVAVLQHVMQRKKDDKRQLPLRALCSSIVATAYKKLKSTFQGLHGPSKCDYLYIVAQLVEYSDDEEIRAGTVDMLISTWDDLDRDCCLTSIAMVEHLIKVNLPEIVPMLKSTAVQGAPQSSAPLLREVSKRLKDRNYLHRQRFHNLLRFFLSYNRKHNAS